MDSELSFRVNVKQFRIKIGPAIKMSLLTSHIIFQIYTSYMRENSTETLGPKYSILNLLKNTKLWTFLCQYHYLAKSHAFGIIRKLDVNRYIFPYTFNQASAMTCELFCQSSFLKVISLHWEIELCARSGAMYWLPADLLWQL